jgi:hypothetical protein
MKLPPDAGANDFTKLSPRSIQVGRPGPGPGDMPGLSLSLVPGRHATTASESRAEATAPQST